MTAFLEDVQLARDADAAQGLEHRETVLRIDVLVVRGKRERLLGFDASEHPVALQLGGSEPARTR